MFRTLLTGTAAVLLASGTAFAVDVEMDENDDKMVDEDEFQAAAEDIDLFAVYDLDDDDVLTREEFYSVTFRAYDENGDGMWSQTEAGVWEDSKLTSGAEKSQ